MLNIFKHNPKKLFEKENDTEKDKTVKTLLWDASFKNQKIAQISFKEPYLRLSKI